MVLKDGWMDCGLSRKKNLGGGRGGGRQTMAAG